MVNDLYEEKISKVIGQRNELVAPAQTETEL